MPGIASSPRRQSAKAPTPGSTTRSARATCVGIAGDHDRLVVPALARGALERLGGRVQIAGAVVDDGDAHRCGSRLREQADDVGRRRRAAPRHGAAYCGAGRSAGGAGGVGARFGPGGVEAPLGHFAILADHEAERLPAAPRQRPAPQRRRLEADQQRDQQAGEQLHRRRRAEQRRARRRARHSRRDSRAAPATAGAPAARAAPAGRPRNESVAHEHEAFRSAGGFALARRRCVDGESGHCVTLNSLRHAGRERSERSGSGILSARPDSGRRPRRATADAHPPSEPLVDGTSSLARGSIATAARSARARPLKQDSAIW